MRATVYQRARSADENLLVKRISATIRVLANARGFSLRDLARASGVERRALSYIAGGIREPTVVELNRIAGALGWTVIGLMEADPAVLAEENRVGRNVLEGKSYGW